LSNLKSLSCSLVVSSEQANQRIDTFFSANCPSFNRSIASLEETKFFINEKEVKKSKKVKAGDKVKVTWQDLVFENIEAQDIPLNILYEDNDILVINKEQNIVVHPASGNKDGTIVNALIHRYGSLFFALDEQESVRPGIVHRLDKDTSGIMVVALNKEAHQNLSLQFKNREVEKYYIALVQNFKEKKRGKIESPIARSHRDRKKFTVAKNGKEALTEYLNLRQIGSHALLRIRLITGRTHQIRVHLSSLGSPIVGDITYGKNDKILNEKPMMLHALSLKFKHPTSNKIVKFTAPLPNRFKEAIKELLGNNTGMA